MVFVSRRPNVDESRNGARSRLFFPSALVWTIIFRVPSHCEVKTRACVELTWESWISLIRFASPFLAERTELCKCFVDKYSTRSTHRQSGHFNRNNFNRVKAIYHVYYRYRCETLQHSYASQIKTHKKNFNETPLSLYEPIAGRRYMRSRVCYSSALNKSLCCREITRVTLFLGIIPRLSQLFIYSAVPIRQ